MSDQELARRIATVLDTVRPNIQMDGGDVEFVKFQDGTVYIRFKGACIGCPAAEFTMQLGIESALKESIPEVERVAAVDGDDEHGSSLGDMI